MQIEHSGASVSSMTMGLASLIRQMRKSKEKNCGNLLLPIGQHFPRSWLSAIYGFSASKKHISQQQRE